jgi:hypothetical protein
LYSCCGAAGLVVFMLQYGLTFEDIVYLPLKKRVGKYKTAGDMPKVCSSVAAEAAAAQGVCCLMVEAANG